MERQEDDDSSDEEAFREKYKNAIGRARDFMSASLCSGNLEGIIEDDGESASDKRSFSISNSGSQVSGNLSGKLGENGSVQRSS